MIFFFTFWFVWILFKLILIRSHGNESSGMLEQKHFSETSRKHFERPGRQPWAAGEH